jgi:poly(3-hydroxybutyrate) depolymerase
MRNLRKVLTTIFAAGAILAAPAAAQASTTIQAPAAAVQHAAVAQTSCLLSIPVFYKKNGNHDFHWTTKDTCARTVRTQLQRSSYRGWVGYDGWRVWSNHTITHKWKEVCRWGAGTYNYRAAVQALLPNGNWGPSRYSGVMYADHCGPSAP